MSSVYFLIGKTLGKYKILEHIGHGGMSEVYKGQQTQLERPVAVKVLHPFLADESGFVTRFQREARIVATLRHPNIVQVFDFDFNEELGIYYMVMEFIDGPTLKSLLETGPLTLEKSMRVGIAIANALDYAHKRDMIHRDVKPANIMFLDGTQPVLTDFGIAKMLTLSGLTASGALVGTPAYIAPEVGIGKAGTALSDVYSLGVVLYQAITGKLPFNAESPMGMVMQHINDAPPRPSKYQPDMPPALEAVIMRALEKQPENRYPNARAMALDITGILSPTTSHIQNDLFTSDDTADDDMWQVLHELSDSSLYENNAERLIFSDDALVGDQLDELQQLVDTNAQEPRSTTASELEETSETIRPNRKIRSGKYRPVLAVFTLLLAIAAAAWANFIGLVHIPFPWLPVLPMAVPGIELTITAVDPSPTAATSTQVTTPVPGVTEALTPGPDAEMTVQPTAVTACKPRMRVDGVRIEPDDIIWAGASMVARVNLSNPGKCAWPVDSQFTYIEGIQVGSLDSYTLDSILPGETLHLVIPFTAPDELGDYTSSWQVFDPQGDSLGSDVDIAFTVADLEIPEPTPMPDIVSATATKVPLSLDLPSITELTFSNDYASWQGVYSVQAEGGTGAYRYYLDIISAETELSSNRFLVTGRRCDAVPVTLWVLSGADILKWEGEVPFPDPTLCN